MRLPAHLLRLAGISGEARIEVSGTPTVEGVLDGVEARYPMLRGTIREHGSGERRAYLRFFAGGEDLSHDRLDQPLPESVCTGEEPLQVVGAIAGGSPRRAVLPSL